MSSASGIKCHAESTRIRSLASAPLRSSDARRMQQMTSDWTRSSLKPARCACKASQPACLSHALHISYSSCSTAQINFAVSDMASAATKQPLAQLPCPHAAALLRISDSRFLRSDQHPSLLKEKIPMPCCIQVEGSSLAQIPLCPKPISGKGGAGRHGGYGHPLRHVSHVGGCSAGV